jgi:hypothetical protein
MSSPHSQVTHFAAPPVDLLNKEKSMKNVLLMAGLMLAASASAYASAQALSPIDVYTKNIVLCKALEVGTKNSKQIGQTLQTGGDQNTADVYMTASTELAVQFSSLNCRYILDAGAQKKAWQDQTDSALNQSVQQGCANLQNELEKAKGKVGELAVQSFQAAVNGLNALLVPGAAKAQAEDARQKIETQKTQVLKNISDLQTNLRTQNCPQP